MDSAVAQLATLRDPKARTDPIALYVHIPFCLSKCIYCDFNTYEKIEHLIPTFVDALDLEISLWSTRLHRPKVASIFFGGGTPSYIPATAIQRLLQTIRDCFDVDHDAEVTLEANPDDVNPEKLKIWRDAGVNRLSIGVQSFDDPTLIALTRRHDADAATQAVRRARSAGFGNISIDLMFGLPDQTLGNWRHSLDAAIELETDHLSLYGLQIEPGTPLDRNVREGSTSMPDDDLAADMYETAIDELGEAGFQHYEISNWAKPGKESRHNLAYWLNKPYLGVGPGAHSSISGARFANLKSPRRYIDSSSDWVRTAGIDAEFAKGHMAIDFVEATTEEMEMSETMMLGMRLVNGIEFEGFTKRFGKSIFEVYDREIRSLESHGLIEVDADGARLTRKGMLLGNEVFERFILT